jgi:hypothetical protein
MALALLLLVPACVPTWETATPVPYKGGVGPAQPTDLTTNVPVSSDVTEGARAVLRVRLGRGDRATLVEEMQRALPAEQASRDTTAAYLAQIAVMRVTPLYSGPDTVPSGSVFDALRPNGTYFIEYGLRGVMIEQMTMRPGGRSGNWGYNYVSGGGLEQDRARVDAATRGHAVESRLFSLAPASWWVVRLDDGSEGAVPNVTAWPVWVDGVMLDRDVMYPAKTVFGETRWNGP